MSAGLYHDDFVESLQRELSAELGRWGLSASTRLSLLSISENATFRADDPERDEPLVLRVHRPGYHSIAEIESELAWISTLRAESIVLTPQPLPTLDGGLIATFEHDGSSRQAVAFEFMPGQELDGSSDLQLDFRRLGAITARLHGHARRAHGQGGRPLGPTGTARGDQSIAHRVSAKLLTTHSALEEGGLQPVSQAHQPCGLHV